MSGDADRAAWSSTAAFHLGEDGRQVLFGHLPDCEPAGDSQRSGKRGSPRRHGGPGAAGCPARGLRRTSSTGWHRCDTASAEEHCMDPNTPMVIAGAKYATRDDAVEAFKIVWGARHQGEFDHMDVAVLTKNAAGELELERHDSTGKHFGWGGAVLGAALCHRGSPGGRRRCRGGRRCRGRNRRHCRPLLAHDLEGESQGGQRPAALRRVGSAHHRGQPQEHRHRPAAGERREEGRHRDQGRRVWPGAWHCSWASLPWRSGQSQRTSTRCCEQEQPWPRSFRCSSSYSRGRT